MIDKLLYIIISLVLTTCCQEVQRTFFSNVNSPTYFASNIWWKIENTSEKCWRGIPLYGLEINFPGMEYNFLCSLHDDVFIICDHEVRNGCDTAFIFNNTELYNSNNITFTKQVYSNEEKYIFTKERTGGRSDFDYSNFSIWGISKEDGIIAFGYFDQFNCLFEQVYGDTIFLKSNISEICKNIDL